MITGGVSIKGSYHDINQDSFFCNKYKNGYIMVLSDGMGSKSKSQYGSAAICQSVYEVIEKMTLDIEDLCFKDILYNCHEQWLRKLYEYNISDCYATMLVLVLTDYKIKAARLGDGFVSVYADETVHCLYDRKEDYFANETDCLRETFDREKVEILDIEYKNFHGAISCSDGVEIRTMQENDIVSFTKDFIEEYHNKKIDDIESEISEELSDWPGCDDKTLAFLMEES